MCLWLTGGSTKWVVVQHCWPTTEVYVCAFAVSTLCSCTKLSICFLASVAFCRKNHKVCLSLDCGGKLTNQVQKPVACWARWTFQLPMLSTDSRIQGTKIGINGETVYTRTINFYFQSNFFSIEQFYGLTVTKLLHSDLLWWRLSVSAAESESVPWTDNMAVMFSPE